MKIEIELPRRPAQEVLEAMRAIIAALERELLESSSREVAELLKDNIQ
jgi:hypothetical protein